MQHSFDENSRILITGASGFVGTWLRKSLHDYLPQSTKFCLTNIESKTPQRYSENENWISVDITDFKQVNRVIKECKPNALVHLAAISNVQVASRSPVTTFDVNLNGTLSLARAIMEHCPNCRFINIGSSEVYGAAFNDIQVPVTEETALKPITTYAASKAAADLLVGQMAHDGLEVIRFRPFNHTGPGQSASFAVPAFATQIAKIERGIIPPEIRVGNLNTERDFTDVRDIVDAYVRAILLPKGKFENGTIFNLGSGKVRMIRDILTELIEMSGKSIEIIQSDELYRTIDIPKSWGDFKCAERILGWKPIVPWKKTLQSVLDGCRFAVSELASE